MNIAFARMLSLATEVYVLPEPVPRTGESVENDIGKMTVNLLSTLSVTTPPWVQGADVADQHLRESNFIKN